MATETMEVSVVLERRRAVGPWAEYLWLPVAVLPGAPAIAAGTSLGVTQTGERFFGGGFTMELHRTDTPTYRENLATEAPQIWVALRPRDDGGQPDVYGVTPDPAEGEAYTETGTDIVEQVAMPEELVALLDDFIAAHHVERVFVKRKRRDWISDEPDDRA